MASDVKDLTRFYANLPSIFETDPSTISKSSSDAITKILISEKTYPPIFGSFVFTSSEPFTQAAFINSTFPSNDVKTNQEEQMNDNNSAFKDNNISNTSDIQSELQSSTIPIEDISDMDDEDDFDGISIRYGSTLIKKNLDNDLIHNHSEKKNLLDIFTSSLENTHEDNNDNEGDDDDDVELFLNGFTDEQQHESEIMPALFKNIPDIDDPNEPENEDDDDDNNNKMLFDPMDMFDRSDSICSSSPDSLLSSSHLREDDDDEEEEEEEEEKAHAEIDKNNDEEEDDDVTQWNDDFILRKTTSQNNRPTALLPPLPIALNLNLHDQVDFIDSSRSNSRCSNDSLHLSIGYHDQARIFIEDDEDHDDLSTSSDSNNNEDEVHFENDISNLDNIEDISLQINLDYHRSRSSSESSYQENHCSHSSSPIPDESPIIAIDEDIHETKPLQSAPIALLNDENDLETFTSNQPILSIISLENLSQLRNQLRQNEIIHDIIDMRYILNEHDNDDDFLAVMHNPSIFEEVLYDNEQSSDELAKQKNSSINTSDASPSAQPCIPNKIQRKSIEHYKYLQQSSSLSVSNSEEYDPFNIKTTNNPSNTTTAAIPVNHLLIQREEQEQENIDSINCRNILEKKEEKLDGESCSNVNIQDIVSNRQVQRNLHRMMSSDDEFDNDSELLNTLAQLHGLVYTPRLSSDNYNQNLNTTNLLNEKNQQQDKDLSNSIHCHESQKENNFERKGGQLPSTNFSLTSLTSSGLLNDDESHSVDIMVDSDGSSSLITSTNEFNDSLILSNQLVIDDSQIRNTNMYDSLHQTAMTINDNTNSDYLHNRSIPCESLFTINTDNNDLITYLHWIISHLNDDLQSSTPLNTIEHSNNEHQQSDRNQQENVMLSSVDIDIILLVEQLVSDVVQLVLDEINEAKRQAEHLADRILSQAIYEVNNEDNRLAIDNLKLNINHDVQTNEQLLDPFDQTFDSLWTKQFQISNNIIDENNFDPISFYSNTFDESISPFSLFTNPFDTAITDNNLTQYSLIAFVRNNNNIDHSSILNKNQPSIDTDDKIHLASTNLSSTENQLATDTTQPTANKEDDSTSSDSDDDDDALKRTPTFFATTSRMLEFEAYASDQLLHTLDDASATDAVDNQSDETSPMKKSTIPFELESDPVNALNNGDEPWELEDSGEENGNTLHHSIKKKFDSYDNVPLDSPTSTLTRTLPPKLKDTYHGESSDEDENENENDNYDKYFSQQKPAENSEGHSTKTVRFDDNIEKVAVLTPKDSLEESLEEASSTTDSADDTDNEEIPANFSMVNDRITDFMNEKETNNTIKTTEVVTRHVVHEPESHISTESEDLPPPLPPLPPLNKKTTTTSSDNIPLKSALSSSPRVNIDLKNRIHSRSDPEITPTVQTTTDDKLLSNADAPILRSFDSGRVIYVFFS
ncbi:unnamed protein product [Rotaria socialis]|uniref:Uncharacterized protein n=1 Tax=Rotaria socialis TaxID=392032 RepID=A0A818F9W3_9BILA|nr:unnamed protein product [Rotaria socialis]